MTFTPWDIILIPVGVVFLTLAFVTLNRYISYKERVALAQLGYSLEELKQEAAEMRGRSRGVLWGGVISATSGLALLLGLSTLGRGVWLIGGLLPLFVGLGMMVIYFLTQSASTGPRDVGLERYGQSDEPDALDMRVPESNGGREGGVAPNEPRDSRARRGLPR